MIRFQYDNKDSYPSLKIQIEDQDAEYINEWFARFFQFMLAASWQPSQIEKYMRETIQELDSDNSLDIRDFAYV